MNSRELCDVRDAGEPPTTSPAGPRSKSLARVPGFLGGGHRNTGYWIAVLLTLLVLLNVASGASTSRHTLRKAPGKPVSYLESDTAKLISASLVPLLIFVVEGRFNLVETIRAARSERRKREQNERRDAWLETIEETTAIWSRITAWVGDAVYWDGTQTLNDRLKESRTSPLRPRRSSTDGRAFEHGRVEGIRFGSRAERHFLRLAKRS